MDLIMYKRMPVWDPVSVPSEVMHKHHTKVGTWGKIRVLSGQLKFEAIEGDEVIGEFLIGPETDFPMVAPQAWHRVTLMTEDTRFFLEFYCEPRDYFDKKYGLGRTHSEVVAALGFIPPGRALDLGCGAGRNSLYLAQHGFDVMAVDQNTMSLQLQQDIAMQEDFDMVIGTYDINSASLMSDYDLIISTVVFQFLVPECVPEIIANMQAHTTVGGYNLIVSAMDTTDAPCPMPFSFTFKAGELSGYYKDWELVKYNEDFGHLHKLDADGNPIRMRFATLLAKKVR